MPRRVLSVVLAACAGCYLSHELAHEPPPPDGGPPTSDVDAVAAWLDAYEVVACRSVGRCEDRGEGDYIPAERADACAAFYDDTSVLALVRARELVFDPAAAARCLADAAGTCAYPTFFYRSWGFPEATPLSCFDVLRPGPAAALTGEACSGRVCVEGTYCAPATTRAACSVGATCTPQLRDGARCAWLSDVAFGACATPGTSCYTGCGARLATVADGAPCDPLHTLCEPGHYCHGVCFPPVPAGGACADTAHYPDANPSCVYGTYCDHGICVPVHASTGPADACGLGSACDRLSGLVCDPPTLHGGGGSCATLGTGSSFRCLFGVDHWGDCPTGTTCALDGACHAGEPPGSTCFFGPECLSGVCGTDGHCVACGGT